MPDHFSVHLPLSARRPCPVVELKVAIFGLGGVGSVVEGLARAVISHFYLMDFDLVEESNINRQIHALTIPRPVQSRINGRTDWKINPEALVCAKCIGLPARVKT